MTKNVDSAKINQHSLYMAMDFRSGRSDVAARLHALDHGMYTWDARGIAGRWVRRHQSWRSRLFTPFKIRKGPDSTCSLRSIRVTLGVTEKGESFKEIDDWTLHENAHTDMGFRWVGRTIFMNDDPDGDDDDNDILTLARGNDLVSRECKVAKRSWADIVDSD